jgi:hypothetical protein
MMGKGTPVKKNIL